MLLYPLRDAHEAIYHLAGLSSPRLVATLTRKKSLRSLCAAVWSDETARRESVVPCPCTACVFVRLHLQRDRDALSPLRARVRFPSLCALPTKTMNQSAANHAAGLLEQSTAVRSSATSFTTAVLDTMSPAAHHSSVQPAPPSPVLAAMFLDLFAIAARALLSDGT